MLSVTQVRSELVSRACIGLRLASTTDTKYARQAAPRWRLTGRTVGVGVTAGLVATAAIAHQIEQSGLSTDDGPTAALVAAVRFTRTCSMFLPPANTC
jgi:hypothetical protein